MNPIDAAKQIEKRLQNYLRMTLPVDRSMPQQFTPKLDEFYRGYRLTQDPFLELMPGYETGPSLIDLANEGVIHRRTAQIFADAFLGGSPTDPKDPANFRLYKHQATAIREVCRNEKNLVVCSGTGSGKTETFLIPL
jgi:ATP-dependent helicase YprA (DUF1998 family)